MRIYFFYFGAMLFLAQLKANFTKSGACEPSTAEEWASKIVGVITAPDVYELGEKTLPGRLNGLVNLTEHVGYGSADGRNSKCGILFVHVNYLRSAIQDITFRMPRKDTAGHATYSALKARLEQKLRTPKWSKDVDGEMVFWRLGKTRKVVILWTEPYDVNVPNVSPIVLVSVGVEQGDKEP